MVGGVRAGAAVREQPAAKLGETFLAGGFEIAAGADIKRDVDERAFAIRHEIRDGAGLELHAELVGDGWLIFQRRVGKFLRAVGDIIGANTGGGT